MTGLRVSSDRLWFWFAVSSTAFVGILAISPVKDYLREYRTYQERYRALLLQTADTAAEVRRARAEPVGIRQIWIPAFEDRVDRCVTCHLGVENPGMAEAPQPFRSHPAIPHAPEHFQRFGCVACHRGQGRATSLAEAHGDAPDWESPLLPLEFTEASCGRCHTEDAVPEASLVSEGRDLVRRAGCFGCHKVSGIDWSSDAPDLNGLSLKTSPEWLRAWLRAPRDLQANTLMPDFGLSEVEIEALVAFLWAQPPSPSQILGLVDEAAIPGDRERGRTLFGESRCVSCHTIEGRGNGSAPELAAVGSKVGRRWLIAYLRDPHAFQQRTPMPRYNFNRQELLDLSSYIVSELTDPQQPAPDHPLRPSQKAIEEGERLYRRYGCAGCHRIAGSELPAEAGPELTGIGDKPVEFLDFGARADLPRTLPAWLAAKVADPRSFREGLKMPRFGFTEDQVRAIVTALLSLGARPVPQAYRAQERPRPRYEPPGKFGKLADRYRCLACHQIEGVGGDISKAPLTAEGSRVRREWLVRYMLLPGTIRPLLTDRMIPLRMPREEAIFLAEFIENVFVDNSVPDEIFPSGPSTREAERGHALFFERYGCQACHMVGGRGGYYGPLLDGAGERLESGWVLWWLLGPQRWRADVRCPDFGLEEKDARDLAAYVVSIPPETATPKLGR